jgi:(S)-citramalyl-CoA lyase
MEQQGLTNMPSATNPTRSWLFTPATRPDRFAKAKEAGADVVIIDLEDAVAPDQKDAARASALDYLAQANASGPARALRINGLDTAAGIADLHALLNLAVAPDFIVLPKTEGPGHLQVLDRLLTAAKRPTRLVGIVESARGLAAVQAIAVATPRLTGLMLGAADLAADLGAATAWSPLMYARSRLVLACALAGVTPIDSPFFNVHDANALSREVADAIAFGFAAKAAIHPSQITPINDALTPSPEAVAHARTVLDANRQGVGVVDGQMVDEAVARKARRTLAAAGQ